MFFQGVPFAKCCNVSADKCLMECVCVCVGGWWGVGGGSQSKRMIDICKFKETSTISVSISIYFSFCKSITWYRPQGCRISHKTQKYTQYSTVQLGSVQVLGITYIGDKSVTTDSRQFNNLTLLYVCF